MDASSPHFWISTFLSLAICFSRIFNSSGSLSVVVMLLNFIRRLVFSAAVFRSIDTTSFFSLDGRSSISHHSMTSGVGITTTPPVLLELPSVDSATTSARGTVLASIDDTSCRVDAEVRP